VCVCVWKVLGFVAFLSPTKCDNDMQIENNYGNDIRMTFFSSLAFNNKLKIKNKTFNVVIFCSLTSQMY
jgi:hypothetical protein